MGLIRQCTTLHNRISGLGSRNSSVHWSIRGTLRKPPTHHARSVRWNVTVFSPARSHRRRRSHLRERRSPVVRAPCETRNSPILRTRSGCRPQHGPGITQLDCSKEGMQPSWPARDECNRKYQRPLPDVSSEGDAVSLLAHELTPADTPWSSCTTRFSASRSPEGAAVAEDRQDDRFSPDGRPHRCEGLVSQPLFPALALAASWQSSWQSTGRRPSSSLRTAHCPSVRSRRQFVDSHDRPAGDSQASVPPKRPAVEPPLRVQHSPSASPRRFDQ
jgi:hypothetical protein